MLSRFGFRSLVLLMHAARRLWSWLIFDVRQHMRALAFFSLSAVMMSGCHHRDVVRPDRQQTGVGAVGDRALIGDATMDASGVIHVWLRAEKPGLHGDWFFDIKPDAAEYTRWLRHLGGLKPGESKGVPPWPSSFSGEKEPNKAPEPTPGPVTDRADARSAPVPVVAHL